MERKRIDFTLQEAGGLLYLADRNLADSPFGELAQSDWKEMTLEQALMIMSLYQDDGYAVRLVIGELADREEEEWTARVSWILNLASGRLVVSGVCDSDLDEYMEDFGDGLAVDRCRLGCILEIPPGRYRVDVYSYPPGDLTGGWMRIEDGEDFRLCFGEEPGITEESPLDYFQRTRPGETPPDWIKQGWEDSRFLNFLIHLSPAGEVGLPAFETDGCLKWEYRKPDRCPAGIRLTEE